MKTNSFILFLLFFFIIFALCLYALCVNKCVLVEEKEESNKMTMVRKK